MSSSSFKMCSTDSTKTGDIQAPQQLTQPRQLEITQVPKTDSVSGINGFETGYWSWQPIGRGDCIHRLMHQKCGKIRAGKVASEEMRGKRWAGFMRNKQMTETRNLWQTLIHSCVNSTPIFPSSFSQSINYILIPNAVSLDCGLIRYWPVQLLTVATIIFIWVETFCTLDGAVLKIKQQMTLEPQ